MYPNFSNYYNNNYYRMQNMPNLKSYIRILHASPNAPAVDIYANNKLIAKNLPYKKFTEYLNVAPGEYKVQVYPAGTYNKPILNTTIEIAPNSIYTVAAINMLKDLQLFPIIEPHRALSPSVAFVRFGHLSPNTPNVDITLPDGKKVFKDVEYKEVTGYLPLAPGNYTLQARPTGTNTIILNVPNINLKPNRFYTIYAVGLLNDNPPLEVLIPLDGNTYLK